MRHTKTLETSKADPPIGLSIPKTYEGGDKVNTNLIRGRLIYLIVVACMVFAGQALATEIDKADVILLKNGNIIRGRITETIPGDKVVIERADGQVFEVPTDEIFAVTDDDQLDQRRKELEIFKPKRQPLKWDNVTIAGLYYSDDNMFFSASTVNGAWFGEQLFLGLGLGWDNYPGGDMVPVFAEARLYRAWRSFRPYAFVDAGYSFGWLKDISGAHNAGLHLNLGVGTKLFAWTPGLRPLIQIGFRVQQAKRVLPTGDKESVTYKYMTAAVGFTF